MRHRWVVSDKPSRFGDDAQDVTCATCGTQATKINGRVNATGMTHHEMIHKVKGRNRYRVRECPGRRI